MYQDRSQAYLYLDKAFNKIKVHLVNIREASPAKDKGFNLMKLIQEMHNKFNKLIIIYNLEIWPTNKFLMFKYDKIDKTCNKGIVETHQIKLDFNIIN